jgi:hypothetical protein
MYSFSSSGTTACASTRRGRSVVDTWSANQVLPSAPPWTCRCSMSRVFRAPD